MRQLRRHSAWVGLLGLLALTLAACGGGGGNDGVATLGGASGDRSDQSDDESDLEPEEAAQKFAECMREHGIDMPDPEIGEDGGFSVTLPDRGERAAAPDPEKVEAAQEACQHYLDDAIPEGERPDPEELARMREKALAFAKCMRDEGIDWPDPQFSEDGGMTVFGQGAGEGPGTGPDPSDPRVEKAMRHCEKEVGLPGPGEGGGPTTERGPGAGADTNAR